MDESKRPTLTIGVVADILSVSVQTLRLWESKGLVSPSRKGKDRYYSDEDLKRLKYIKFLLHEKKLNTYGVRELLLKEGWEIDIAEEDKPAQGADSPARTESHAGKKTVLVIDDDPDYSAIVKTALESEGYRVTTAVTGREGLSKLETESPDLVILDIMIPDVDGLEICRIIKTSPATASMPVIIASSIPATFREKYGIKETSGDVFMQKPLRPSEIAGEVRKLIG